jgi:hypothetical protein
MWLLDMFDKVVPNLLVKLVGGAAAVLVGRRVAHYWSMRQFLAQQDRIAAQQLSARYGDFFAIWKLWNILLRAPTSEGFDIRSRELLDRACKAEADVEASLLWLASTRDLPQPTVKLLGEFRQCFQQLREAIREQRSLPWHSSEHPEYRSLKDHAAKILTMVEAGTVSPPSTDRPRE